MRRLVTKSTLVLYLLQAIVPLGYMPAAIASGEGFLMLCPSAGAIKPAKSEQSTTGLNLFVSTIDSVHDEHNHHRVSNDDVEHDHADHSHHQSDNNQSLEAHHSAHEQHNAFYQSNNCDYAAASLGHDFFQTSPLEHRDLRWAPINNITKEIEIITVQHTRKQWTRGPPGNSHKLK